MLLVGVTAVHENNNMCNIVGTDVVFALPQLRVSRFNCHAVYSKTEGLLVVGGEPIKKEVCPLDARLTLWSAHCPLTDD